MPMRAVPCSALRCLAVPTLRLSVPGERMPCRVYDPPYRVCLSVRRDAPAAKEPKNTTHSCDGADLSQHSRPCRQRFNTLSASHAPPLPLDAPMRLRLQRPAMCFCSRRRNALGTLGLIHLAPVAPSSHPCTLLARGPRAHRPDSANRMYPFPGSWKALQLATRRGPPAAA